MVDNNTSRIPLRIKLCGMTRPEDAALASELGADAVGMIFYPKSKRNISIDQAKEIIARINPLCSTVAVMFNPDVAFVEKLISQLSIQLIQFHGDETPEFCQQFCLPYIKAIRVQADISVDKVRKQHHNSSGILLDTFDKHQPGGTGKIFDWSLIAQQHQSEQYPELILAGGLSLGNVHAAIEQTGIRNLDINSGIESSPGIKDHKKMREMMKIKMNSAF